MASLDEEQLWQMVHDFIESDPPSPVHCHHSISNPCNSPRNCLQEILGEMTDAEARILNRVEFHMRKKTDFEKNTKLKRWLAARLKKDGFDAALCRSSGGYEYVDVLVGGEAERVVVDVELKPQFAVARPTPKYEELTAELPEVFVGAEERLRAVVGILCAAAEESLKERGMHVPPWRRTAHVQSRWLAGWRREEGGGAPPEEEVRGKWEPPRVKPTRGEMARSGGSGLSSHFANMSINCC